MTGPTMSQAESRTQYLNRPEGRIAFDVAGSGPLVVAVPGMGDSRGSYRFLVPPLVAAGYRVATVDLRGHGESDASFQAFDDEAAASDVAALVDELGGPATVIGNSMGAGAATIVAADRPELVDHLVLIGPFVRDLPMPPGARVALRAALVRPWGPAVWRRFHRRLFPAHTPDDYDTYSDALMRSLTRPGAWRAFQRTARTSHEPAARRLSRVHTPTLVVMGTADPDFKDPVGEADLVAGRLSGVSFLVPGSGHYPQAEFPDIVANGVIEFLGKS